MIRPVTCPICKRQLTSQDVTPATFPFCSERCRQVDLCRWFDGKYAIVEPAAPELLDPELIESEGETQPSDE